LPSSSRIATISLVEDSVRYMKRFFLLLQEIFLQAFPDCLNFSS
jgi:hypothetical protein